MALMAKDEAKQRELVPAKAYPALVCGVIDLGTQVSEKYGPEHKITIGFELFRKNNAPACNEEGEPLSIWRDYTLKFSKIPGKTPAALRTAVEDLLNREFTEDEAKAGYDLEKLLSLPCRVKVKHETRDGKTFDGVSSIEVLDEDEKPPTAEMDHLYYELDVSKPIPSGIPQWIKKKIERSIEWKAANGGSAKPKREAGSDDDDNVPY